MTQQIAYTITKDSVSVISGGRPTTVYRGNPNFEPLRQALIEERWADAAGHLRVDDSINKWAKGHFTVKAGIVLFDGQALPADLNKRIVEMATAGDDPTALFKFWERLQKNPSKRSVDQLWNFLNLVGIPLTKNGTFLAYKGVREDFKDCHSGTIDNTPGRTIEMPRNQISDDPNHACHAGLHVGAYEYASTFGPNLIVCEVDPADVVCVPNDHSYMKMRVSKYKVVGLHNGQGHLPDTYIDEDDVPVVEAQLPRKYARFRGLSREELMSETTETLRDFAANGLGIVRASRILGGKTALVDAILLAAKKLKV